MYSTHTDSETETGTKRGTVILVPDLFRDLFSFSGSKEPDLVSRVIRPRVSE